MFGLFVFWLMLYTIKLRLHILKSIIEQLLISTSTFSYVPDDIFEYTLCF